jgi:hypothetical protein
MEYRLAYAQAVARFADHMWWYLREGGYDEYKPHVIYYLIDNVKP